MSSKKGATPETDSGGRPEEEACQQRFPREALQQRTHRSSTDADARLARRSQAHPALLSYRGHLLSPSGGGYG